MIGHSPSSRYSSWNGPLRIRTWPILVSRILPFTLFLGLALVLAIPGLAQSVNDSASPARQATALVLVKAGTRLVSGTAVCIDGGGVFVTNAHTVAETRKGATVQLVLEAGENNQKVVAAQLLVFEEASDLAVLKAVTDPVLKPVELANDSERSIKESVVRLRYPGVGATATGYPRVASKNEVIVALPRDKDGRQQIQLEAPLGVKATEGAFFDERGKLVGIAVRRPGPDGGLILPASRIAAFIPGQAIIDFDPPPIQVADIASPATWSIRLRRSGSKGLLQDLDVSVTVTREPRIGESSRLSRLGGQYRVTAIPVPPGADSRVALISSEGGTNVIAAVVPDQQVQVGGTPVRLNELAYVEKGVELRLISTNNPRKVPTSGSNLVVLADLNGTLEIRIFDDSQRLVVDMPEPRAGPIADLKKQVASLLTRHEVTSSEKDRVLALVTEIVWRGPCPRSNASRAPRAPGDQDRWEQILQGTALRPGNRHFPVPVRLKSKNLQVRRGRE